MSLQFPERLLTLLARRRRAKKFGLSFTRARAFQLPLHLTIGQRELAVFLPAESGVLTAVIDILLDDCYGLSSITAASTVLDIGANVGLFSLAARHAFPHATIHAYEPNSALESYLAAQAAAAGFKYFLEAVGPRAGRVQLDVHEDSVLTRSREDPQGPVPQVALQTAVDRLGGSVALAKLDCEGAEWDLLRESSAWQCIDRVAMEYHLWSDRTHDEARLLVSALGYRVTSQQRLVESGVLLARR